MPNYVCRLCSFRKEPDMNVSACTDRELVEILVGKKTAARIYEGYLLALFSERLDRGPIHPRLAAARELTRRALREKMERQPALSSPQAVRDYLRLSLAGKEYEVFVGLFLDAQNRLIAVAELFQGTLTQTSVFPREIVKRALQHNAAAVMFAHNHPSGVAEPSRADELLTQTLKHALALIDVKVLDHFIIGSDSVMSFAERGII